MKSNLTVLILLAMFIINDSSMYIIIFFKGKPSKIKNSNLFTHSQVVPSCM